MSRLTRVHPTYTLTLAAVSVLLVTVLALLPGRPGFATAAALRITPTIVLEHGAWADCRVELVVQRLQADGYTVDAPPNPLRGLASDAANLTYVLKAISGPIVLVGHSYGGAVITNAATGNPQVKALVYIDAFIPDQGETVLQLAGAKPGSCLAAKPATVFNFVSYLGAAKGDALLYVKPRLFARCFANGLSATEGAVLGSTQTLRP